MISQKEGEGQQEQQQLYKGCFLTLKANNLVEPDSIQMYENLTSSVMKSQGLMMIFSLFWARVWEVSNFPRITQNRYFFYGGAILIPNIINAVYVSYKMNDAVNQLDSKYSDLYFNKYLKNVAASKLAENK